MNLAVNNFNHTKQISFCSAITMFMILFLNILPWDEYKSIIILIKVVSVILLSYTIILSIKHLNNFYILKNNNSKSNNLNNQINLNLFITYIFIIILVILLLYINYTFFGKYIFNRYNI